MSTTASHSVSVNSTLMQLSRTELDAIARQLTIAHDRQLRALENELGDRLYGLLDSYRRTFGETYHPKTLDNRQDLSV